MGDTSNKDKQSASSEQSDSDSEMLSSTCDESSSYVSSSAASSLSGDESPPGSPPRAITRAPTRVPALQIKLNSLQPAPSPKLTARNSHDGGLQSARSHTTTIGVELISTAFKLDLNSDRPPAVLEQQCAANLGVPQDRLRYYALVEVPNLQRLPQNCDRVALEVLGSNFSLQAVEEMLAENNRLRAIVSAKEADGQLAALLQENDSLRRRLASSETLRTNGQRALNDLKHEFQALHEELTLQAQALNPHE